MRVACSVAPRARPRGRTASLGASRPPRAESGSRPPRGPHRGRGRSAARDRGAVGRRPCDTAHAAPGRRTDASDTRSGCCEVPTLDRSSSPLRKRCRMAGEKGRAMRCGVRRRGRALLLPLHTLNHCGGQRVCAGERDNAVARARSQGLGHPASPRQEQRAARAVGLVSKSTATHTSSNSWSAVSSSSAARRSAALGSASGPCAVCRESTPLPDVRKPDSWISAVSHHGRSECRAQQAPKFVCERGVSGRGPA